MVAVFCLVRVPTNHLRRYDNTASASMRLHQAYALSRPVDSCGRTGNTGLETHAVYTVVQTRSLAIAEGPRDASCQLKSCQLARNSAETTCTSPEQIEAMKLEGYIGPVELRLVTDKQTDTDTDAGPWLVPQMHSIAP